MWVWFILWGDGAAKRKRVMIVYERCDRCKRCLHPALILCLRIGHLRRWAGRPDQSATGRILVICVSFGAHGNLGYHDVDVHDDGDRNLVDMRAKRELNSFSRLAGKSPVTGVCTRTGG